MKKLDTLLLFITLPFFIISCNDSDSEVSSHQHTMSSSVSSIVSADIEGMSLNNGQKWKMDPHTRLILADMKAESTLLNIHTSTTEERQILGKKLSQQLESLIQGCTMEGAEHDQLHIFLTGFIPALNELTETGRVESAEKVNHYLNNYSNYFE